MNEPKRFKVEDSVSGGSFLCSPDQSLLVAMERTHPGLIKVGGRGGGCGLCKIRVVSGEYVTRAMSRAKVSLDEVEQGYVLACRAYPSSDLRFVVEKVD